tara:strand:- start:460 stop:1062 length:603 start_codon:yes stop_codon:yes gene_type:complete
MQTLYHHTHNITGKKYLGQTTRDLNVYKGSSVEWLEHLEQYGDDYSTEILFESSDKGKFKEVCQHYSEKLDVVKNNEYFNKVAEYGGSMGGAANPNFQGKGFTGRLDDELLYRAKDKERNAITHEENKDREQARMKFSHHKKNGNIMVARYWFDNWYKLSKFTDPNPQSLQKDDTFELWYYHNSGRMTDQKRRDFFQKNA